MFQHGFDGRPDVPKVKDETNGAFPTLLNLDHMNGKLS